MAGVNLLIASDGLDQTVIAPLNILFANRSVHLVEQKLFSDQVLFIALNLLADLRAFPKTRLPGGIF